MNAIGNGILIGVMLSFMAGPALFMLLQTSLKRGFRYGWYFAFGIIASDALVLFLVWRGISQFLGEDPRSNIWFSMIGGIILILFGAYTFMKPAVKTKPKSAPDVIDDEKPIDISEVERELPPVSKELVKELFPEDRPSKTHIYLIKGFVSNIVNPGVWFIWISAMVTVTSSYAGNTRHILSFFAATLITIFGFDTLKSYIADRLKNFLKPHVIHRMNQIIGCFLVLFGIYLIASSFYDLSSIIDNFKTTNLSPTLGSV
ncbi:MAG: LysE family transporter [Bacteroidales bacterium]|nr:LysE family transporter [Bacteroidales bacterium]